MDITLSLTHACNLACSYCYAGPKFQQSMSWETAKTALDFAVSHSLDGDKQIQLGYFGGEPLLEWDLLTRSSDYLKAETEKHAIKRLNTLTTNCTLLTPDKVEWLKSNDYYLGLSIDGNADMHFATRPYFSGKNSHGACVAALQSVIDVGANYEVVVTIDPSNVDHLPESMDWLADMKVERIALNPNFYLEWPEDKLQAWRRGYEYAGEIYKQLFRENRKIHINFIHNKVRLHLKGGHQLCDRCNFGEREIAVSPSGKIYPCERLIGDDTNDDMCIGDVFNGFDETRRQAILKKRGNANEECIGCAHRERCMNFCGCINYATTGEINKVHALICYHEQLSIEVADQLAAELYEELNPLFLATYYGDAPDDESPLK